MGIIHKIKGLAGLGIKDEPKKPRAATVKAAAVANEEYNHEDHAGQEHSHDETAPEMKTPQSVEAAVGIGATKYILRPLVTEKGTYVAEYNTYLFAVMPQASKPAIKQAIEKLYGVTVTKIRTMRYDGKVVRSGRIEGRRSNFKKAYVTVAKGQSITIHKGV